MSELYCNNCGKKGHQYNQCKLPITSVGVISFRIFNNEIQYLLIRRKDTLGFIDFMRGKYSAYNKDYIKNMVYQMTDEEKLLLKTKSFDELWVKIWGNNGISTQYKNEENNSKDKFETIKRGIHTQYEEYNLQSIIDETQDVSWKEQEWGFPKGRRNYQEKDFDCATREFCEETGFNKKTLHNIKNIYPYEEIFTGSNYKSYKHKYYVAYIQSNDSHNLNQFQRSEVGKLEWKTYDNCIKSIREYNLEKKRILTNIDKTLKQFPLVYFNVQ